MLPLGPGGPPDPPLASPDPDAAASPLLLPFAAAPPPRAAEASAPPLDAPAASVVADGCWPDATPLELERPGPLSGGPPFVASLPQPESTSNVSAADVDARIRRVRVASWSGRVNPGGSPDTWCVRFTSWARLASPSSLAHAALEGRHGVVERHGACSVRSKAGPLVASPVVGFSLLIGPPLARRIFPPCVRRTGGEGNHPAQHDGVPGGRSPRDVHKTRTFVAPAGTVFQGRVPDGALHGSASCSSYNSWETVPKLHVL